MFLKTTVAFIALSFSVSCTSGGEKAATEAVEEKAAAPSEPGTSEAPAKEAVEAAKEAPAKGKAAVKGAKKPAAKKAAPKK